MPGRRCQGQPGAQHAQRVQRPLLWVTRRLLGRDTATAPTAPPLRRSCPGSDCLARLHALLDLGNLDWAGRGGESRGCPRTHIFLGEWCGASPLAQPNPSHSITDSLHSPPTSFFPPCAPLPPTPHSLPRGPMQQAAEGLTALPGFRPFGHTGMEAKDGETAVQFQCRPKAGRQGQPKGHK